MKKCTFLFIALVVVGSVAKSQPYATSLSQNFDVICASTSGFPTTSNWLYYNPIPSTDPQGAWHCDPLDGRPNSLGTPTPGMLCSGVWSSIFHLDTSYLLTPHLLLGSYSAAYLHFDTRADSVTTSGARIALMITTDTGAVSSYVYVDSSAGVSPTIGPIDASGWVTHEINISAYTGTWARPFYIVFRYVSPSTTGSIWYLDNVNITTYSTLNTQALDKHEFSVVALGTGTTENIDIALSGATPGEYQLFVYDMMGRVVHYEKLQIKGASQQYTINGLNLSPGMYFIKIGNGIAYGTAKAVVR